LDNSSRTSGIDLDGLKVLSRPEVIALLGVSKVTFDRIEARGAGPAKIQLSPRRIGYRVSAVRAWLDSRERGGGNENSGV
jgi:predicted DNA-binding transcriptional regulator AlpA